MFFSEIVLISFWKAGKLAMKITIRKDGAAKKVTLPAGARVKDAAKKSSLIISVSYFSTGSIAGTRGTGPANAKP